MIAPGNALTGSEARDHWLVEKHGADGVVAACHAGGAVWVGKHGLLLGAHAK